MSFKQLLWLVALSLTLQTEAVSPSLRRLQDENAKLAETNKVLISALKEITTEEFVGQKFDRCAKRTICVADCVAGDEPKRFQCLKDVCPKEMCVEEDSVGQMFDRCATRTKCVADCVAGDESKRFECLKNVCPKELCVEESVGWVCMDNCQAAGFDFFYCQDDCFGFTETRVGSSIEQRVKEIIAEEVGMDVDEIENDDTIEADLIGFGEISGGCVLCEVWLTLEDEYNNGFEIGNIEEVETVQDMIDIIESLTEESVSQKFDRCATRTKCVADCVAGDESKRFECLKNVCPKELCVEETVGWDCMDNCNAAGFDFWYCQDDCFSFTD